MFDDRVSPPCQSRFIHPDEAAHHSGRRWPEELDYGDTTNESPSSSHRMLAQLIVSPAIPTGRRLGETGDHAIPKSEHDAFVPSMTSDSPASFAPVLPIPETVSSPPYSPHLTDVPTPSPHVSPSHTPSPPPPSTPTPAPSTPTLPAPSLHPPSPSTSNIAVASGCEGTHVLCTTTAPHTAQTDMMAEGISPPSNASTCARWSLIPTPLHGGSLSSVQAPGNTADPIVISDNEHTYTSSSSVEVPLSGISVQPPATTTNLRPQWVAEQGSSLPVPGGRGWWKVGSTSGSTSSPASDDSLSSQQREDPPTSGLVVMKSPVPSTIFAVESEVDELDAQPSNQGRKRGRLKKLTVVVSPPRISAVAQQSAIVATPMHALPEYLQHMVASRTPHTPVFYDPGSSTPRTSALPESSAIEEVPKRKPGRPRKQQSAVPKPKPAPKTQKAAKAPKAKAPKAKAPIKGKGKGKACVEDDVEEEPLMPDTPLSDLPQGPLSPRERRKFTARVASMTLQPSTLEPGSREAAEEADESLSPMSLARGVQCEREDDQSAFELHKTPDVAEPDAEREAHRTDEAPCSPSPPAQPSSGVNPPPSLNRPENATVPARQGWASGPTARRDQQNQSNPLFEHDARMNSCSVTHPRESLADLNQASAQLAHHGDFHAQIQRRLSQDQNQQVRQHNKQALQQQPRALHQNPPALLQRAPHGYSGQSGPAAQHYQLASTPVATSSSFPNRPATATVCDPSPTNATGSSGPADALARGSVNASLDEEYTSGNFFLMTSDQVIFRLDSSHVAHASRELYTSGVSKHNLSQAVHLRRPFENSTMLRAFLSLLLNSDMRIEEDEDAATSMLRDLFAFMRAWNINKAKLAIMVLHSKFEAMSLRTAFAIASTIQDDKLFERILLRFARVTPLTATEGEAIHRSDAPENGSVMDPSNWDYRRYRATPQQYQFALHRAWHEWSEGPTGKMEDVLLEVFRAALTDARAAVEGEGRRRKAEDERVGGEKKQKGD
ncbi:unnamed protein product [Cutaneotrichosporon oleaginosum]